MKKILTLLWGMLPALFSFAQGDFPLCFADSQGNIIAGGTTLNLSASQTDDFGSVLLPSGLYVKNMTSDAVQCGGRYTVQSISNGIFQTCFPANCMQRTETGTYESGNGFIAPSELKSMLTEWIPAGKGTCTVTYQLLTYRQNPNSGKWMIDAEGPAITLNFSYDPSLEVETMRSQGQIRRVEYYSPTGLRVEKPVRGVYIRKSTYSDGTVAIRKEFLP